MRNCLVCDCLVLITRKGMCRKCYDESRKDTVKERTQSQEFKDKRNARTRKRYATESGSESYKQKVKFNSILYKYGLTYDEYYSMLENQNNCCAVCGKYMDNPVIDHCHVTGRVRGLLHNKCNAILGMADDNPNTLRWAAEYIEYHSLD